MSTEVEVSNEWLEFDFIVVRHVTGVKTRARSRGQQWVEQYKLQIWNQSEWLPTFNEQGDEKVSHPKHKNLTDCRI